jgi:hypothetical protein
MVLMSEIFHLVKLSLIIFFASPVIIEMQMHQLKRKAPLREGLS